MSRRTMVIDLDRCTGCRTCIVSCKFENDLGLGNYRCDVLNVGPMGTHPDISMYYLPLQCQQCEDAPCIEVCPTGASYRADNGVVLIDDATCIGCKTCLSACPFSDADGTNRPSVRWYNEDTMTVTKCTLCNHFTSTSDGVENHDDTLDPDHAVPPCVHNCSAHCRFFGDLDDPESAASIALAEAESEGRATHTIDVSGATPTTVYILSESIATWDGMGDKDVVAMN